MIEIWKDIKGYEGIYQISSLGRVKSLERWIKTGRGGNQLRGGIILNPKINTAGYYEVGLRKTGKKRKFIRVHQLVAIHFIPNPENKPCIDHINRNRTDNRVENLRWCTYKENSNNPLTIQHLKDVNPKIWKGVYGKLHAHAKPIIQFDLEGNLIRKWDCAVDAVRQGNFTKSGISSCLKGAQETHRGSKWKYYDTDTYLIALMVKNLKAKGIILRNAS